MTDLEGRADAFLQNLTGPMVILAHGVLPRVLRARLLGMDAEEMHAIPIRQGVISHLSQEFGHVTLEK